MKKVTSLFIALLSFCCVTIGQSQKILEFKVQYMASDDQTWGVYARPTTPLSSTLNNLLIGSGQVTLLMNNNGIDEPQNIKSVNGRWTNNPDIIRGPIEAPNTAYFSFRLNGSGNPISLEPTKELLLFTFQLPTCPDTIGLIDNNTDPFSVLPNSTSTNPGIDLKLLDPSTGILYNWKRNYAPFAFSCADCDNDGIVDALEDTNGDGVFTTGVDVSNLCNSDNNELDTPPALTAQKACITVNDVSYTSPSGCGKTDGSITIDAVHESGNFIQYSIDGGRVWNNSETINNLQAGVTYNLELRDNIGLCLVTYGAIQLDNPNCVKDPCITNPFTIANQPDQMICAGGATTLNISGGSTYAWSPAQGLSATSIANPIANPTVTTTYTVVVTNEDGCTAQDEITVNVVNNPTTNAGQDQSICANTSLVLAATGGNDNAYSWSPTTGIDNANIQNPTANPTTTTTYTVTITDANGCTATDEININVTPTPIISAEAIMNDCSDEPIRLLASGGQTYVWSPAIGLDDPSSATPIASPTQTTIYTVLVTDENGCTAAQELSVAPPSATISIDLGEAEPICLEESILLNDNANSAYSYTWNPIDNLDDPTSLSPMASPRETTTYCVTVTSIDGCTATDCIIIEVDEFCEGEDLGNGSGSGGAVNPCLTAPEVVGCPDKYICPEGQTQLIVSGGIRWEWSPSTGLDDPTSSYPIASPTETTTYTVTGWDANGCFSTDEVIVTVVSSGNCGLTPATCQDDDLLADEKLCIDVTANVAEICIPYALEDFNVTYTIELVNSSPKLIHGCNFGDLYGYQYNFLPEAGLGGNYRIKGWSLNNSIQAGVVNSMQELLAFMQSADPAGNWTIDPARFSILGGSETGIYGDLIVTQPNTAIETVLRINKTQVPKSTLIEVDMAGKDREVLTFTDLVTGCVDQLIIERPTVCEDCATDCVQVPTTKTITFRPGPDDGQDTYVLTRERNEANDNIRTFGDRTAMAYVQWTWNAEGFGEGTKRAFINFPALANLPTGAVIKAAKLSLFGPDQAGSGIFGLGNSHYTDSPYGSNADNKAWIKRVLAPWDENTVNWNTQPATTAVNQVEITGTNVQYGTVKTDIDVTALVQDMLTNNQVNGFSLQLQKENTYRSVLFATSENEDASLRPMLVIEYE